MIEWTCLGAGPQHCADVERVEWLGQRGSSDVAIERCRACGQLYRFEKLEISDWGPSGDYYSETFVWRPLAPDEVAALQGDLGYQPRSEARFSHQPGWRSG